MLLYEHEKIPYLCDNFLFISSSRIQKGRGFEAFLSQESAGFGQGEVKISPTVEQTQVLSNKRKPNQLVISSLVRRTTISPHMGV